MSCLICTKFYIEKSTVHLTNSSDLIKLKEFYSNDNINEKDGLKIIRDNEVGPY